MAETLQPEKEHAFKAENEAVLEATAELDLEKEKSIELEYPPQQAAEIKSIQTEIDRNKMDRDRLKEALVKAQSELSIDEDGSVTQDSLKLLERQILRAEQDIATYEEALEAAKQRKAA